MFAKIAKIKDIVYWIKLYWIQYKMIFQVGSALLNF